VGTLSSTYSGAIAKYADHYLNRSTSPGPNLSFKKMHDTELVEIQSYINGHFIETVSNTDTLSDGLGLAPDVVTKFTCPSTSSTKSGKHYLKDGDVVSGFAFADGDGASGARYDDDNLALLNYKTYYVKRIDDSNFYLYNSYSSGTFSDPAYFITDETTGEIKEYYSLLAKPRAVKGSSYDQNGHYWVKINDGSYNGSLLCFDPAGEIRQQSPDASSVIHTETFGRPTVQHVNLKVVTPPSGIGGETMTGSVATMSGGDTIYLDRYGLTGSVWKAYSDSSRSVPLTVNLEPQYSSTITVTRNVGTDNYGIITDTISDSSLITYLKQASFDNPDYNARYFHGLCRLKLTTGQNATGAKALPSAIDDSEFFCYVFDSTTNEFVIYEDLFKEWQRNENGLLGYSQHISGTSGDGYSKHAEVLPPTGSAIFQVEIQFCNTWGTNGAGRPADMGIMYNLSSYHDPVTAAVGPQGVSGSSSLAHPIIGVQNDLFTHTYVTPSNHPSPGTTVTVPTSDSATWPSLEDLYIGWLGMYDIWFPGNRVFSYKNSSNVTVYEAGALNMNNRWVPTGYPARANGSQLQVGLHAGATTGTNRMWRIRLPQKDGTSDNSVNYYRNEARTPDIYPQVDSNGYLVANAATHSSTVGRTDWWSYWGVAVVDGNPMTVPEMIDMINDYNHMFWTWGAPEYTQKADEYVAPTPYAEDVWDTDSEWDTDGYDAATEGWRKQWPKHITPRSIKVIQATPNSTTTSQSGIKYVRSLGIVRHQIEVTYPPMTETDFRTFEATAAAARGQATPFYFDFDNYGNNNNQAIAFNRIDANAPSHGEYSIKEATAVGNKYVMLEGFEANATDVILKGEFIIGNEADGGLMQAVSTTDSNIFGEAKFRTAVAARNGHTAGSSVYKNPAHAIVTLAEDTLEYNIGMDQLYTFTVRFDFDEWK
jgi:hypothetical protein